ncbi:protein PRRC2B isoform X3 [Chelonus insularis]|uniref:protein PRRC2B isoform X3 n=1 Tax=Chelonus insularis TaxID=460826 RepID=UPI00158E787A|nr:protein PRRC2B-like isoform X3 [Chelonus insularis]
MSTLSGIVSKGEKGKSKFQSLDINSLYRVSRGESLEQHQQKSTLPRKHGMQSLGKVPSARRPPANLPSLKSEYSSSDPAVSLVPSGGSGWATTKEPSPLTTSTTTNATTAPPSDTSTTNSSTSQCAAATTPVSAPSQQPSLPGQQQQQQQQQNTSQSPHLSEAGNKSSWSAIMSRPGDAGSPVVSAVVGYAGLVGGGRAGRGALGLSFLAHQSPQFQHEFPSLSGQPSVSTQNQTQQSSTTTTVISVNVQHQSLLPQQSYSHNHPGASTGQQSQQNREMNAQYGPGPSLRPQTEGSWIQGGSRTPGGASGTGGGSTPVGQGPPIGIGPAPGHSEGLGGGRQNLGPSPVMGTAQAGQQSNQSSASTGANTASGPNLHHYRGLIPPFMYRGNSFPQGGFQPQISSSNMSSSGPRPRFNNSSDRFPAFGRQEEREGRPLVEEVVTRPIIKEEDLTRMDDISHDPGWAAQDDIDYNQKLTFSDDEPEPEPTKKEEKKESSPPKEEKPVEISLEEKERLRETSESPRDSKDARDNLQSANRSWYPSDRLGPSPRDYRGSNGPTTRDNYSTQPPLRPSHPLRGVEEEEIWNQRRREQGEKVASAVVRARQRKEEEEKRFQESKQAAAKKLQDLEQKMKKKQAKTDDSVPVAESKGLINIPSVPIPVPDWERERENRERESRDRERSRTSSEDKDEKPPSRETRDRDLIRDSRDSTNDFSNRTNFMRPLDLNRAERDRDRDQRENRDRENRDRDQPAFSRQFQSNLPPRFQKQQAERSGAAYNRVSPNAERISSQPNVPFSQQYDPGRWSHNSSSSNNVKQSHSMPLPQRRRTDSDIASPLDEDPRPPSRDHGSQRSRDDRFRPSMHHLFDGRKSGYHDDYGRYKDDYDREHDDRHSRESWDRDRDRERDRERMYDDKDRDSHSRSSRDSRDFKDRDYRDRDGRESRDNRDIREKDYDNYIKSSTLQDNLDRDDRESTRERSESGEWGDSRRDDRSLPDDNRREPLSRDDRIERNERPQRPDSRDSRTSRESKASLRDDDFHKSRDSSSWIHDISDYEEKKRDIYRDDHRERDRERDRRQPPGPITREKLQAEDLKNEKRNLTQLKRGGPDQEKKDPIKESPTEVKKEPEGWRKLDRTPETTRANENSPKAWADAVSPTFEKDEEKIPEPTKDEKDINELKASMEKLSVEKREELHVEEVKEEPKDEKREKNTRNRTSSGSFRGREPRGGRSWGGAYNVYTRGWRGPESRGRRGAGSRSIGRPGSAKSGSYGHTDSEISGDEVSGSTESGKDERRTAVSPKPAQKSDKDDRNREVSRRDDKRNSGEYPSGRNDKRGGYDGRPSREGFAPSGEPSRRGRGGFRARGATSGGRMEGYGPPPSKSPFSTDRSVDEKQNTGAQNSPIPVGEGDNQTSSTLESTDDKIIAKQHALTAGITGRRNKSPNPQNNQNKHDLGHPNAGHNTGLQKNLSKKDDLKSKRTRSGSRRSRDNRDRVRGSNIIKQNSTDVGNEEWETTSENSEDHIDDHKDNRNSHNKQYRSGSGSNQNSGNNPQSRRHDQVNNREQREKSKISSRAPGAEKRNAQNAAFNQRNHSGNIPLQGPQTQNGRPRSQGSANNQVGKNKETTVNRVDEIKLNDPNAVDQIIKDVGKKFQNRDKKSIDSEIEANNYSTGGDDGGNSTEDKVDADGFQEVRSKKNQKDSRQKEEPKPSRREKDKERERDRSKSKSNGPQPNAQPTQNIPPLLGQPIPQPANLPRSFDRSSNRNKLAPRFQKQKLAKQQQQHSNSDGGESNKIGGSNSNYLKDSSGGPAPPPSVNAWDKPFTSQLRSNSPNSGISADIQLMSGLTGPNDHAHEMNEQANSAGSSQRNSPNGEKALKAVKESVVEKNVADNSSPPVQTLIFENTNYSKTTKGPTDMAIKSKFSNHMKSQQRVDKRNEIEEDNQLHQQQALSVAFSNKPNDLMKEKTQEPIQMPLSFNKSEDNADMKLDFSFDPDLTQLTDDKSKSLGMPRSMHMTGGQSTISPSTAELNLKIASVKKVWENAPPMPTVVEHEDGSVVTTANSFTQSFETGDVDDNYSPHQQYNQSNMKNEITTSTNVCKLVPPQVKPQQQSSGSGGAQTGSTVPGPSPIGPGQSPIGHPPASLQGPLSPPPFNSTGQPSHINYQEFPQYPGSQAAQYGSMSAIPSPPAVLFNTGSGQLPAQAGGLYGAFQLDQSRSPFTQYPPYGPSLQSSYNQQNMYLQQPPPHAPNAPAPDMYQSNLSQYRIPAAAAPPFGQNQQLSNNPNPVLISSSSNSLMSASVKPSSQPIGTIGTKAQHFQAPSAPQPNQLTYIPYDPNQVLGVSGSYMGNSQLVQRAGPSVQASANSYYSATSDVFPGSQTGFFQPGGAAQQTGTHYGLQGFGQHSQSLATGNAAPVGLQSFSSQFLSGSGLQIAAAAAAQQYRNPTGGLPGPANAAATFLSKHQQQEQPRQLKSPSGNQQDVLASVFSSTPQIPSPKSRNCKQQSQSQQPQPSPTQHHKYQQYQGVNQSALVSSYNTNYVLQQNVRGMSMPPRAGIQPSQQRYPPPIQRPVPFPPGPNPNNPSQQQQNCIPSQQQNQINRHRPNIHQQQRNMKMQQQYYSGQGNVKMDTNEKVDSHNDKIVDGSAGNQGGGNKSNVTQQDGDVKEEVNQQNE